MKKLIFASAFLCTFGLLTAQQPGTIDENFANNGKYSLTVDNYRSFLNFVNFQTFEDDGDPATPAWGLIVGGTMYTNSMSGVVFCTEFTDLGETEWYGQLSTNLSDLQDAIYMPGGGILVCGNYGTFGGSSPIIAKLTSPGVVDETFGSSGSINIDSQTGNDYVHALCYNNADPDNPYIMVAGSSFDSNSKQHPTWWKLDGNGSLDTGFGTNGKYWPNSNPTQAWFNDIIPFGAKVVGLANLDQQAYMHILDPNTMTEQAYLWPDKVNDDHIFEFFFAGQDADNFYPSGYFYDVVSAKSNALVKKVDKLSLTVDDHDAMSPGVFVTKVEEKVKGRVTGVQGFFPAPLGPENSKSQGPAPMIMIGSLIIGDQAETTFLAGMSADGDLDDSFGDGGVTVLDLDSYNWPTDYAMGGDGSIFVGINAEATAYVIKFYPFYDLSGTEQDFQLIDKLEIFPNPADEYLNLTIVLEDAQSINWTVVNSLGQVVYSKTEANLTSGSHQLRVDVKNWIPGVYFFKTNTLKKELTSKFIVK